MFGNPLLQPVALALFVALFAMAPRFLVYSDMARNTQSPEVIAVNIKAKRFHLCRRLSRLDGHDVVNIYSGNDEALSFAIFTKRVCPQVLSA
jgi:hypothetical protein